jgi:hypothetical protein
MIPDRLFDSLCAAAREAVWDAYEAAWAATAHPQPEEVEHVFALVTEGVSSLSTSWTPILKGAGISFRTTGVFIHQTPKAHYDHPRLGPSSPELGDLLLVHDHLGREAFRRAALIQVKRCSSGVPGPPDEVQEYLYCRWPDFELKGHGPRGSGLRYLPGDRTIRPNRGGSRYGLVADDIDAHARCPGCFTQHSYAMPWTFVDPEDAIRTAGGEDAGSFIAGMLYESSWPRGRLAVPMPGALALSAPGSPNNHFAVTVEELIRVTGSRTMAFKRYKQITGSRRPDVLCLQYTSTSGPALPATGGLFAATDGPSLGGAEGDPGEFETEAFGGGGIPVLLIETGGD